MGMFFHLKANIIQLKQKFTVRAFFTLLVGFLLLAGNCYLFFASAMRAFSNGIFPQIMFFIFGTIGFIASCFAIVTISFGFAVEPQNAKGANGKSVTDDFHGKSKLERIAFIVLIFCLRLVADSVRWDIISHRK